MNCQWVIPEFTVQILITESLLIIAVYLQVKSHSISSTILEHIFSPLMFFSAEGLLISAASRRLHAWKHIQRATQRSPFRLREALFIVLPRRGNQSPLLQIRGGRRTLTQEQSLMVFLCASSAKCVSMIGQCYHSESPGGMLRLPGRTIAVMLLTL